MSPGSFHITAGSDAALAIASALFAFLVPSDAIPIVNEQATHNTIHELVLAVIRSPPLQIQLSDAVFRSSGCQDTAIHCRAGSPDGLKIQLISSNLHQHERAVGVESF